MAAIGGAEYFFEELFEQENLEEQAAILEAIQQEQQQRLEQQRLEQQRLEQQRLEQQRLAQQQQQRRQQQPEQADFSMSRQSLGASVQNAHQPPAELEYGYLAEACLAFHNDRLLGEGAFGRVYRGVDQVLGTRFAVKVLSDAEQVGQFEKELKVLSNLSHPNVIRLLGFSRSNRGHLLVYPLAAYGSLDKILRDGDMASRLSWSSRLAIALGTAKALAFLHRRPQAAIFHRDVKAANIVLDTGRTPLLIDCGLSTVVDLDKDKGKTSVTVAGVNGTGPYMDPVFIRTGKFSERSDVYAFGVVVLELLTGKVATDADIVSPVVDEEGAPVPDQRPGPCPADIANELAELVTRCLAPKIKDRPDMPAAIRVLKALDQRHSAARVPELLEEARLLAQAAELARARTDVEKRQCIACAEECIEGVACAGGSPHFLCTPCLAEHIRTQQEGEDVTDRMRGDSLLCIVPNCESEPLEDHLIMGALHKHKHFSQCFLKLKKKAVETVALSEMDRRVRAEKAELARLLKNDVAEYHRRHIQEEILTLRCPRCQQAFNDFNGCLDLECSRQGCGVHFCGLCLADCGQDAHAHVRQCPLNPNADKNYFVSAEVFARLQRERRQRLVNEYLAASIPDQRLRAEVVRRAKRDFDDLGLQV